MPACWPFLAKCLNLPALTNSNGKASCATEPSTGSARNRAYGAGEQRAGLEVTGHGTGRAAATGGVSSIYSESSSSATSTLNASAKAGGRAHSNPSASNHSGTVVGERPGAGSLQRAGSLRQGAPSYGSNSRNALLESTLSSAEVQRAEELNAKLKIPFDDITLHQIIGKGSFKTVYRGKWNNTNVAVVAMRKGGMVAEARVLQQLSMHPNICTFYRWTTDNGGNEYLVMELVQLGSLEGVLRSVGAQLQTHNRLAMCEQICNAMLEVAQAGIVHGDLAARNILVKSLDPVHLKVTDFGLARPATDPSTPQLSQAVACRWSAPEVLRGMPPTEKSDVWSFGVTAWEIFAHGAEPWPSRTDAEVVEGVFKGDRLPVPLGCPSDMYRLMLQCWAYDPDARPSFADIARKFKRWRDNFVLGDKGERHRTQIARISTTQTSTMMSSKMSFENDPIIQPAYTSGSSIGSSTRVSTRHRGHGRGGRTHQPAADLLRSKSFTSASFHHKNNPSLQPAHSEISARLGISAQPGLRMMGGVHQGMIGAASLCDAVSSSSPYMRLADLMPMPGSVSSARPALALNGGGGSGFMHAGSSSLMRSNSEGRWRTRFAAAAAANTSAGAPYTTGPTSTTRELSSQDLLSSPNYRSSNAASLAQPIFGGFDVPSHGEPHQAHATSRFGRDAAIPARATSSTAMQLHDYLPGPQSHQPPTLAAHAPHLQQHHASTHAGLSSCYMAARGSAGSGSIGGASPVGLQPGLMGSVSPRVSKPEMSLAALEKLLLATHSGSSAIADDDAIQQQGSLVASGAAGTNSTQRRHSSSLQWMRSRGHNHAPATPRGDGTASLHNSSGTALSAAASLPTPALAPPRGHRQGSEAAGPAAQQAQAQVQMYSDMLTSLSEEVVSERLSDMLAQAAQSPADANATSLSPLRAQTSPSQHSQCMSGHECRELEEAATAAAHNTQSVAATAAAAIAAAGSMVPPGAMQQQHGSSVGGSGNADIGSSATPDRCQSASLTYLTRINGPAGMFGRDNGASGSQEWWGGLQAQAQQGHGQGQPPGLALGRAGGMGASNSSAGGSEAALPHLYQLQRASASSTATSALMTSLPTDTGLAMAMASGAPDAVGPGPGAGQATPGASSSQSGAASGEYVDVAGDGT